MEVLVRSLVESDEPFPVEQGFRADELGSLALTQKGEENGVYAGIVEAEGSLAQRHELPNEIEKSILSKLVEQEGFDPEASVKSLDNVMMFLDAISSNPGIALSPSPSVDKAWHHLILHTEAYAEFCQKKAGRFLHHRPSTQENPSQTSPEETYELLVRWGYKLDADLWIEGSDCDSGCDGGGGGGGDRCDSGCDGR